MCALVAGNADSAKRVMSLVRCAGFSPSAEIYTSLMHACVKQGSEGNIDYAFEVGPARLEWPKLGQWGLHTSG